MKKINIKQLEMQGIPDGSNYESIIEAVLFASGEPLKIKQIASIIECNEKHAKRILDNMIIKYNDEKRGIKLICINDSYQLVTKPENSNYVSKLLKTNSRQSLSQAAMETLAIISYKQPITRIDVDEIRGVKSDRAILTLQDKGLIKENGRLDVPGRPILYSTTDEFLKSFSIGNLEELPHLDEFLIKNEDSDDKDL
ncbi:SMC-Scp complex subunit ScpB [Clostridium guangxiense]|uniref:SMC-Scp complex subunit ScpB n=1 Tax=Clostridium guangxiense TaxID=1662055 RepID=UPI001E642C1E|nr:SMC-Scp complex subunit ScpB [Clostridium guangxiense]MCD2345142.1 segregation/condensation protein B [Clostridium guangxiense]